MSTDAEIDGMNEGELKAYLGSSPTQELDWRARCGTGEGSSAYLA